MQKPTLIVLAAGIGSRYGGLKQVDPIGPHGEMIIDYSIYDAMRAGFSKVVFVINRNIEAVFRERVGRQIEAQCETVYVFQDLHDLPAGFQVPPNRTKPWGTGHAALCGKQVVRTPFAVINGDDFYGRASFQVLGDYLAQAQDRDGIYDFCMVGFAIENTLSAYGYVSRGVCHVDQQGNLIEVHERTHIEPAGGGGKYTEDGKNWVQLPAGTPISMNMWGFTLGFMDELAARFPIFLAENAANLEKAEFFLPLPVNQLLAEQKATVRVLPTQESWFGVTYQQDKTQVIQAVQQLIDKGVYPANLWG